jgi:hypothetical protein
MAGQVANGKTFPLLDRLNVAHHYYLFSDVDAFSGRAVGIETDKLGYFALSVVWRMAVHVWSTPFGGRTTQIQPGRFEDLIRQFLLGQTVFPNDVVVMVHVCTDRASIWLESEHRRTGTTA